MVWEESHWTKQGEVAAEAYNTNTELQLAAEAYNTNN